MPYTTLTCLLPVATLPERDETHMDLGECHLQLDYEGETVQREVATVLDMHPMNVFDQRLTHLVDLIDTVSWENDRPRVPNHAIR